MVIQAFAPGADGVRPGPMIHAMIHAIWKAAPRRAATSGEKGVSLIETLMALGIAMLALGGVIALVVQVQTQSKEARAAREMELLMTAAGSYARAHWDFLKSSEEHYDFSYEQDGAMISLVSQFDIVGRRLHARLLEPFLPFNHSIAVADCAAFKANYPQWGHPTDSQICRSDAKAECGIFLSPYKDYFYQVQLVSTEKVPYVPPAIDPARIEAYENQFYVVVSLIMPDRAGNKNLYYRSPAERTLSEDARDSVMEMVRIISRVGRGVRARNMLVDSEDVDPNRLLGALSALNMAYGRSQKADDRSRRDSLSLNPPLEGTPSFAELRRKRAAAAALLSPPFFAWTKPCTGIKGPVSGGVYWGGGRLYIAERERYGSKRNWQGNADYAPAPTDLDDDKPAYLWAEARIELIQREPGIAWERAIRRDMAEDDAAP